MTTPAPSPLTDAAARRRNVETLLPLAPLQEGILFHCLAAPRDAGLYMPQMAYHLRGAIEPDRLRAAWAQALDRHQALRASIRWEERDEPFQVIWRRLDLPWTVADWRGDDADARLQALFAENRARPFDLRAAPLFRLTLARAGADRWTLVLCHHHIILDGWSAARLLEDVMTLYRGAPLPPARPYADYLRWLKKQDAEAAAAFWRERLAGLPGPAIAFGGAGARPDVARRDWPFPDALAARVPAFCAAVGVTLNTLLQGALGLSVAERLGRADVVFGAATAGRPADLPGAAAMVGLFINALPVRATVRADETVAGYLRRLQAEQAGAIAHEHLALRRIQAGTGTLFDCLLVVENYPVATGGGGAVALDGVAFDEWTHFPLTLLVAPGHAGMKLILRHDRSVLSDDALDAFVARFAALVEAMTGDPAGAVGALVGPLSAAAPTPAGAAAPMVPRPPETETERAVAALWAEALKRPAPLAADDFFALGGHSLPAARLAARLTRDYGVEVPVRAVFDHPVLADFAAWLDAARAAAPEIVTVEF